MRKFLRGEVIFPSFSLSFVRGINFAWLLSYATVQPEVLPLGPGVAQRLKPSHLHRSFPTYLPRANKVPLLQPHPFLRTFVPSFYPSFVPSSTQRAFHPSFLLSSSAAHTHPTHIRHRTLSKQHSHLRRRTFPNLLYSLRIFHPSPLEPPLPYQTFNKQATRKSAVSVVV